ncbi:uncharacterized protein LOC141823752 [Curcuma longa]|uniref:uncharacterized protein LOC141823752 n=1 Tax=Curcuma longa TaxID=136217 RepID=UPI003D9ED4A3
MTNSEASGRLIKWMVELSEYDIQYLPRTAIKAQALADFLTEVQGPKDQEAWKVYVDGSATKSCSGVGVLLQSPQGDSLQLAIKLQFRVSNNEAEYEALIAGLQAAKYVGAQRVIIHSDSQLAARQLEGTFEIHNERLQRYAVAFDKIKAEFQEVTIVKIPRADNCKADELAKLVSAVHTWTIEEPAVQEQLIAHIDHAQPPVSQIDWRAPFISFLRTGVVSKEAGSPRTFKQRAACFTLIGDLLYKRVFSRPLLKCLSTDEADYVLREIHQGCCGNHSGGRTCQRHQPVLHQPAEYLKTATVSCPFDRWGMDIVGPFPPGQGQKKFLLVAVDYFSKWVEAEALARITEDAVLKFLWRNIVYRYGVPRQIVSDNGRQFQGRRMREWCQDLSILHICTSVYYPQSNGQTEVVNRELVRGLRVRLDQAGGRWVEELHSVLWAYRTTPREGTGMTPFHLVYGGEAVIPVEIGLPSPRVQAYTDSEDNAGRRLLELDFISEDRAIAHTRLQAYRQRMSTAYNKRVFPRSFQVGDIVWKKLNPMGDVGKLEPRWEGPFSVTKKIDGGSYYLADQHGKELKRPWNAQHLRPFYS